MNKEQYKRKVIGFTSFAIIGFAVLWTLLLVKKKDELPPGILNSMIISSAVAIVCSILAAFLISRWVLKNWKQEEMDKFEGAGKIYSGVNKAGAVLILFGSLSAGSGNPTNLIFALPAIVLGAGLIRRRGWARVPSVILSALIALFIGLDFLNGDSFRIVYQIATDMGNAQGTMLAVFFIMKLTVAVVFVWTAIYLSRKATKDLLKNKGTRPGRNQKREVANDS